MAQDADKGIASVKQRALDKELKSFMKHASKGGLTQKGSSTKAHKKQWFSLR